MLNQNNFKKHFIASVAYTVLSVIALISGGICAYALFSLADSIETAGALGVISASFVVFVLFILFCVSAIVLSMLGAGFAIPFIKMKLSEKANIVILICNIVCFVAGTLLLILILTNQSLVKILSYI